MAVKDNPNSNDNNTAGLSTTCNELSTAEYKQNLIKQHHQSLYEPTDGGAWAWLVCFASFWTNGTLFGIINSFGVIYVKLKDKYGDREDAAFLTSLVGSLGIGMTFLLSPVAGILTDCFGIRKTAFAGSAMATLGILLSSFVERLEFLYLTYGLLFGSGASLAYTPSLVILGHYFHKRMGLVNGIVTFGSSVFTIILPLLLHFLLNDVGLQGSLQVLAAMVAVLMVCSLVFRPRLIVPPNYNFEANSPGRNHHSWTGKCRHFCTQFINTSIWKNKRYVIWACIIPIALFGYFVPYIHLVKYVRDILPNENGEVLLTCIGATSGVGRIIFGNLADFPRVNRIFLQQISFFCIGIITMLLPIAGRFEVLIVMCLGLGLFDGCFISLLGPIAFDITGPQGASQAIGFLLGLCSFPLTIGPPIAGKIYDKTGTYTYAFLAAGVPPIVGAFVMFLINRVQTVGKKTPLDVEDHIAVHTVEGRGDNLTGNEEVIKLMPDNVDENAVWQKQVEAAGNIVVINRIPRSHSWNDSANPTTRNNSVHLSTSDPMQLAVEVVNNQLPAKGNIHIEKESTV